jgi:hypothetical protein
MNNLAELKRRICNTVAEAESIRITTHLNPDGGRILRSSGLAEDNLSDGEKERDLDGRRQF